MIIKLRPDDGCRSFPQHDPRIKEECERHLKEHPLVAAYLARCLRLHNGSVLVARVICESLVQIDPKVCDDLRRVQQYALHDDRHRMPELAKALRRHQEHLHLFAEVQTRLQLTQEEFEDKCEWQWRNPPLAVRENLIPRFLTFFNCAFSMMSGYP